ncbi:MAG: hypothetical protein COT06_11295 [Syntrophobacteraceae bacterium CG07_land_8_20_14_0_80_61_8]|nr:MAG: hypothetical protein COT06_11295 [Syntrophobacteraceae bacterium CG07_land_8_20_14_0_80_61_8]
MSGNTADKESLERIMSKQANPKIIGLFVLGAIVLSIAGVLLFGAGTLFQRTRTFVTFFEGSVKGLAVGAPVAFRGVNMGKVSKILLSVDAEGKQIQIPVLLTFQPDQVSLSGESRLPVMNIEALIERGLRAQLVAQSLVTGQLMIELDFHPGTEARYVKGMPEYPELPTVPSDLEQLMKRVGELPLETIANSLSEILTQVKDITNSGNLNKILENVAALTGNADQLLISLNRELQPAAKSLTSAMDEVNGLVTDSRQQVKATLERLEAAIAQADRLFRSLQDDAGRITVAAEQTATAARATLSTTNSSVDRIGRLAAPDSPVLNQLTKALRELSASAKALRGLADYLERHPEALLRGKSGH